MIYDPHINIFAYHWVWYMLGFMAVPRLTFMIWLSIHYPAALPLPLLIIGWIFALTPKGININCKDKK